MARTLTRSSSAVALLLAGDGQRLGELVGDRGGDGLEDVVLVVHEDRELRRGRRGEAGLDRRGGEDPLRFAQRGDERLGGLEALGDGLLVGGDRAGVLGVGEQLERLRGGLGLDHHDRDVAVLEHPAGDDHVERGLLELGVGRERDPLALDQRDPDAADRPENGRPASWVDMDAALIATTSYRCSGLQREDRLDDLDLVAQALDEGRAQRAVDQPAGEDRVLGRAALAAEERAGDAPGRVHPLLDVHGQREEVETLPRLLARGGRRQDDGLVVQDDEGGAGRLTGETAGFEPDFAYAKFAVVDNGFGALHTLHG